MNGGQDLVPIFLASAITIFQSKAAKTTEVVCLDLLCFVRTGGNRMFSKSFRGLLAASSIVGYTIAGTAAAEENVDIRQAYIGAFGQNGNGTVLDNLARVFQQLDSDGQGITADSIQFIETVITSQRRGYIAGEWLRYDLNGDLRVSREEFAGWTSQRKFGGRKAGMNAAQKLRVSTEMQKRLDSAFKSDLNDDGFIDGVELYQPPERRGEARERDRELSVTEFAKSLLKSDRNGDGVLTQLEASQLAAETLVGVDEQIIKTLERREGNRALGMTDECPQIDVSKDSQLVLFGSYESTSLSNVTIAGQDDVTKGAAVFIEDGAQPLTLFLSSHSPMIWQFSGAVQRVSKVVAFGGNGGRGGHEKPAAGVIGIDKSKLEFVKSGQCFRSFDKAASGEGLRAKAAVERMTGRAPDILLGKNEVTVLALPSGAGLDSPGEGQDPEVLRQLIEKSGAKFFTVGENGALTRLDATAEQESHRSDLLRYNPSGIMSFSASDVVSDAKVEAYEVYPEHAGLMQLKALGKITDMDGQWRINEAIRFPAGLAGALSAKYLLPKGIKMPEGDVGHSCVMSEDAGGGAVTENRC